MPEKQWGRSPLAISSNEKNAAHFVGKGRTGSSLSKFGLDEEYNIEYLRGGCGRLGWSIVAPNLFFGLRYSLLTYLAIEVTYHNRTHFKPPKNWNL